MLTRLVFLARADSRHISEKCPVLSRFTGWVRQRDKYGHNGSDERSRKTAFSLKSSNPKKPAIAFHFASSYACRTDELVPANWQIDSNYVVPRLDGNEGSGLEPGQYTKLTI